MQSLPKPDNSRMIHFLTKRQRGFFTVPQYGRTGPDGQTSASVRSHGIAPTPALKASRKPIKLRGLAWDPSAPLFQQQTATHGIHPTSVLELNSTCKFNKTRICH